jgi:hypothetical protein
MDHFRAPFMVEEPSETETGFDFLQTCNKNLFLEELVSNCNCNQDHWDH